MIKKYLIFSLSVHTPKPQKRNGLVFPRADVYIESNKEEDSGKKQTTPKAKRRAGIVFPDSVEAVEDEDKSDTLVNPKEITLKRTNSLKATAKPTPNTTPKKEYERPTFAAEKEGATKGELKDFPDTAVTEQLDNLFDFLTEEEDEVDGENETLDRNRYQQHNLLKKETRANSKESTLPKKYTPEEGSIEKLKKSRRNVTLDGESALNKSQENKQLAVASNVKVEGLREERNKSNELANSREQAVVGKSEQLKQKRAQNSSEVHSPNRYNKIRDSSPGHSGKSNIPVPTKRTIYTQPNKPKPLNIPDVFKTKEDQSQSPTRRPVVFDRKPPTGPPLTKSGFRARSASEGRSPSITARPKTRSQSESRASGSKNNKELVSLIQRNQTANKFGFKPSKSDTAVQTHNKPH